MQYKPRFVQEWQRKAVRQSWGSCLLCLLHSLPVWLLDSLSVRLSVSASLSHFPAAGGVMLAAVEEKQNGRGRQKIIMTDMEAKNCLAERREICYGKQQWQKLPPYLKMTESTIVDLGWQEHQAVKMLNIKVSVTFSFICQFGSAIVSNYSIKQ